MSYLVGVEIWWTRRCWCWFLDHSPCDHLPFLGQDLGGNYCRGLSSLGSWQGQVWLNRHITFFIGGDPLQKSTSGAVGRKWNGSPVLVVGSEPSCCCWQDEQVKPRERSRGLRRNKMHKFSTSSSKITYSGSICCSRGPRAFLKTWVFHMFHQVSKPIDEEVKDKSAGIGMWRLSNML